MLGNCIRTLYCRFRIVVYMFIFKTSVLQPTLLDKIIPNNNKSPRRIARRSEPQRSQLVTCKRRQTCKRASCKLPVSVTLVWLSNVSGWCGCLVWLSNVWLPSVTVECGCLVWVTQCDQDGSRVQATRSIVRASKDGRLQECRYRSLAAAAINSQPTADCPTVL